MPRRFWRRSLAFTFVLYRQRREQKSQERKDSLRLFAANLEKAFYGFEPDFFQHNLLRIVDDSIGAIKSSLELWPTLVEICYFQKIRNGLPMRPPGKKPVDRRM